MTNLQGKYMKGKKREDRGIDPFLRIKPRDAKEREKTDLVAIGGYHDIGEERGKWEKKKK